MAKRRASRAKQPAKGKPAKPAKGMPTKLAKPVEQAEEPRKTPDQ